MTIPPIMGGISDRRSCWPPSDKNKICGMIASCDHFRREPYPGKKRPRASMDLVHVACRRVRARRQKLKTRTATRLQTPRGNTLTWDDSASRMRPPSGSKSPRPVSRRGLCYSCDDEDMPVICPTCQTVPETANPTPAERAVPYRGYAQTFVSGNTEGYGGRRWSRCNSVLHDAQGPSPDRVRTLHLCR